MATIILAAGASSRMGRAKALLPTGQSNHTLISHAIGQGKLLGKPVSVVVGAHYPLIRFRSARQPANWIVNEQWSEGLASSLNAGLRAMPVFCPGVFVLLADQPLLSVEGLCRLQSEAQRSPHEPCAALYGQRVGVPAYLPRKLWPALRKLRGDRGAAELLRRIGAKGIPFEGVYEDVDSPADWTRVRALLGSE